MYSPNHLLLISQFYILFELLQKQAAAARRNGVGGRIGNTMPTAPNPPQTRPVTSHINLENLFPFFLQRALACSFRSHTVIHYNPWPHYLVSLHFWQIPYTSMRCPVGLNFVVAATFFVISFTVISSRSVMVPHFKQIRFM